MKHRNLSAAAAHARKAGPHQRTRGGEPIPERPGYGFGEWSGIIIDRLRAGRDEYGNGSFALPRHELLREVSEEAADLAGWGFILWSKAIGVDLEDTLRRAPEYLRAASHATVWPPPESKDPRVIAVWLGALSHAVMRHLDRITDD